MLEQFYSTKGSHGGMKMAVSNNAGSVILSAACARFVGDNHYVQLYIDSQDGVFGIKPIDKEAPGCVAIRNSRSNSVNEFSAASWLKAIGVGRCAKIDLEWDDEAGMFVGHTDGLD